MQPFEAELYEGLDRQGDGGVLAKIRETKDLGEDVVADLRKSLDEIKENFVTKHNIEKVAF